MNSNLTVAVAGNPNVGKSTVFNALTGLKQHTGNWAGKTVGNAEGYCRLGENTLKLVDIPGTYSLLSRSREEEIARDFILFSGAERVLVVCDATSLERNLNLCLQIMEIHPNVLVCVNLMDEARHKNIKIDLKELERELAAPVVSTVARNKKTLNRLKTALAEKQSGCKTLEIKYPEVLEETMEMIIPSLEKKGIKGLNLRWLSLRLLSPQKELMDRINEFCGFDLKQDGEISNSVAKARAFLAEQGVSSEDVEDLTASAFLKRAEEVAHKTVSQNSGYSAFDRRLDRLFTGKFTGNLIMLLLLGLVLWITVSGANYISQGLSWIFLKTENAIMDIITFLGAGERLKYFVSEGILRVPFWVIAVMLPPMAIFFPLFTFLEDLGYLPRVAFNLDKPFMKCKSCGKQALTMCMSLGCNAVGVTGSRIIDSKRERLLAILTNSFVPCNGRFPTLTAIISVMLAGLVYNGREILSALLLCFAILLGIGGTFAATRFLSATVLKGESSSYTLEMPPFRRPQAGKIIVRSIFDRTLFVLGRAICVAVPSGLVIFLMGNVTVGGETLLSLISEFLDPLGRLMGLDGIIILAYILSLPANEILIPLILMGYLSAGTLSQVPDITLMREILISNGWTVNTAVCTVAFTLFHWPCATTLLTVKKETGSLKWTALAAILPTALGFLLCVMFTAIYRLIF